MTYGNALVAYPDYGNTYPRVLIEAINNKFGMSYYGVKDPVSAIVWDMGKKPILAVPSQNNFNIPTTMPNAPSDMKDFANELSNQSRIDNFGCACGILGGVNFALLGTYYVQPKREWREPLIDYWILLAQPSMMKTAIISSLRAPFEEFQVKLRKEYADRYITPEVVKKRKKAFEEEKKRRLNEELAKLKGDARNSIEKVKEAYLVAEEFYRSLTADITEAIYPRLFWSSGTMKGLAGAMAEQKGCLGVMESEETFLDENLLKSKPDIELFLKGWDQGQYQRTVDGKNVLVNNASLPILFAIQNNVGNELFSNKRLAGRGALARFLTYWVPSPHQTVNQSLYPFGLIKAAPRFQSNSNHAYETYCKKVSLLLERSWTLRKEGRFIEISLGPEAKEFLEVARLSFESKLGNPYLEFMADWLGKAHGFLLRIAGDIHCWNNPESPESSPITRTEMEAANEFVRVLEAHAGYSFSPNEVAMCEDAKLILRYIKNHPNPPIWFESRIFYQNIRGIDAKRVSIALEHMERWNQLVAIPKKRSGHFVILHPQLFAYLLNNTI